MVSPFWHVFFLGAHETSVWKWPDSLSLWEVLIPPELWVRTRAFMAQGCWQWGWGMWVQEPPLFPKACWMLVCTAQLCGGGQGGFFSDLNVHKNPLEILLHM